MYELPEPYPPPCRLADRPSRDRASVSQLMRKVRLAGQGGGYRAPLPAENAHRLSSCDAPGGPSALASCPMLSGEPAYDCASVIKVTFPGETGHDKAPWTIRQDHPGGKAPALGTHHET